MSLMAKTVMEMERISGRVAAAKRGFGARYAPGEDVVLVSVVFDHDGKQSVVEINWSRMLLDVEDPQVDALLVGSVRKAIAEFKPS